MTIQSEKIKVVRPRVRLDNRNPWYRLISVVDVVITHNESIPTNTIPHLIFCRIPVQNFILCWLKHDEIAEEEKYLRGRIELVKKHQY